MLAASAQHTYAACSPSGPERVLTSVVPVLLSPGLRSDQAVLCCVRLLAGTPHWHTACLHAAAAVHCHPEQ